MFHLCSKNFFLIFLFFYLRGSKILGPVYVSLLVYVFLLGELSPLILRDIQEKKLLPPVIFVVRVGILFFFN